jgi:hypothetical protein
MSSLALGFGLRNVPPIDRVPHVEVTALSGVQTNPVAVTLQHTPFSGDTVLVFLSNNGAGGLLMAQGVDYQWTPSNPLAITFTGQNIAGMTNPVIQVLYWPIQRTPTTQTY